MDREEQEKEETLGIRNLVFCNHAVTESINIIDKQEYVFVVSAI